MTIYYDNDTDNSYKYNHYNDRKNDNGNAEVLIANIISVKMYM